MPTIAQSQNGQLSQKSRLKLHFCTRVFATTGIPGFQRRFAPRRRQEYRDGNGSFAGRKRNPLLVHASFFNPVGVWMTAR
jgi:hypothetical protein